jgi:hypothetical protein
MMHKNLFFGTILTISMLASNLRSAEEANTIPNEATSEIVTANMAADDPSEKAVFEAAQIIADALVNIAEADIKVADVATEERTEIVEGESIEGEVEKKAAETEIVVENVKIIAETIIKAAEDAGIDITNIAAAVVAAEKQEIAKAPEVVEVAYIATEEKGDVADRAEVAIEVIAIEPALVAESDKIEAEEMVKTSEVFDIEVVTIATEEPSEILVAEIKVEAEAPNVEDTTVRSFEIEAEAIIQIPENFSVRPAYVVAPEKKAPYEAPVKTKIEIAQDNEMATLEESKESFGFKVAKTLVPVLGVALIIYAIVKLAPSIIS